MELQLVIQNMKIGLTRSLGCQGGLISEGLLFCKRLGVGLGLPKHVVEDL